MRLRLNSKIPSKMITLLFTTILLFALVMSATVVIEDVSSDNFILTNTTTKNNFTHLNISTSAPYDNLILYIPFDTNTSTTNVYDYSANENDGTPNGDAHYITSGKYGGAFDFDANGDSVTINHTDSFNWTGNEMTISLWINQPGITALPGYSPFVVKRQDAVNRIDIGPGYNGGTLFFDAPNSTGASNTLTLSSYSSFVTDNLWHHHVFMTNSSGMFIYIDTVKRAENSIGTSVYNLNSVNLLLGERAPSFFNGSMDEVMIFNSSLTPQQIENIYNNQSSRFVSTGTQEFLGVNVSGDGTENRINISINSSTYFDSIINVSVSSSGVGGYCLQEHANVSTGCGGLSTGAYWVVPNYLYINYTKPPGSLSAEWQVKHGTLSTYNATINTTCFSDSTILRLRFETTGGLDNGQSVGQCWNGSSWINTTNYDSTSGSGGGYSGNDLERQMYDGDYSSHARYIQSDWKECLHSNCFGARVFEEAVIWNINNYSWGDEYSFTNGLASDIEISTPNDIGIRFLMYSGNSSSNSFYSPTLEYDFVIESWTLEIENTNVSECKNLTTANTVYNVINDLNSNGTCIYIKANNITLEGNGYNIDFSQGDNGIVLTSGVNVFGANDTLVRNLTINSSDTTADTSLGIWSDSTTPSASPYNGVWEYINITGTEVGFDIEGYNITIRNGWVDEMDQNDLVVYEGYNITFENITSTGDSQIEKFGFDPSGNILVRNYVAEGNNLAYFSSGGESNPNVTIIDSVLNGGVITESGDNLTIINTTYSSETVDGGTITRMWYLTVNVTDASYSPLNNANVNISNVSQSVVSTTTTGADGLTTRGTFIQYLNSSGTTTSHTPHNITAWLSGYTTNSSEFTLSSSTIFHIGLDRVIYDRNVFQGIQNFVGMIRLASRQIGISQALELFSQTSLYLKVIRPILENLNLIAVPDFFEEIKRDIQDYFNISSSIDYYIIYYLGVGDSFEIGETIQRFFSGFRIIVQQIEIFDIIQRFFSGIRNFAESIVIGSTINVTNSSVGVPYVGLELVTPSDLNGINVARNQFFNVTVNLSCSESNCGEVNVSFISEREDNGWSVNGTPYENFNIDVLAGTVEYAPFNNTFMFKEHGQSFVNYWDQQTSCRVKKTLSIWANISGDIPQTGYSYKPYQLIGTSRTYDGGNWGPQDGIYIVNETTLFMTCTNISNSGGVHIAGSANITWTLPHPVNDSKWHHYSLVQEGLDNAEDTTSGLRFYYDGVNVANYTGSWEGLYSSGILYHYFAVPSFVSSGLQAEIDEIRKWTRDLSSDEVLQVNNSGIFPNSSLPSSSLSVWTTFNSDLQESYVLNRVDDSIIDDINEVGSESFTEDLDKRYGSSVSTLGYLVNISIANMSGASLVWDNGTIIDDDFTGAKTFTFLSNQTLNINDSSFGTIFTTIGETPFYTNDSNPRNVSLNVGESQLIVGWINATGEEKSSWSFFVHANVTSNMSISNLTERWNVTISGTNIKGITQSFNIDGITNRLLKITKGIPQQISFSSLISRFKELVRTITQDMTISFIVDRMASLFRDMVNSFSLNSSLDVMAIKIISIVEGLEIQTTIQRFFSGVRSLLDSITIDSAVDATNFTATGTPYVGLELIAPPDLNDLEVTQNQFFPVTVNVSCLNSNCGGINVSFDPVIVLDDNETELVKDSGFRNGAGLYGPTSTYVTTADLLGNDYHGLMEWDISSIPAGSLIGESNLTIYWRAHYLEAGEWANFSIHEFSPGFFWYENGTEEYTVINETFYNTTVIGTERIDGSGTVDGQARSIALHKTYNITQILKRNYDLGTNVSILFYFNRTISNVSSGTDHVLYSSREEAVASRHPFISVNYDSIKSGLVSTTLGDTPFYTNSSINPINISLNVGESQLVTMWINATGDLGTNHTFFVFANRTANMTQSNITGEWNVTIVEATAITTTNVTQSFDIQTTITRISNSFRSPLQSFNIDSTISRFRFLFISIIQSFNIDSTISRFRFLFISITQQLKINSFIDGIGDIYRIIVQTFNINSIHNGFESLIRTPIQNIEISSLSDRMTLLIRSLTQEMTIMAMSQRSLESFRTTINQIIFGIDADNGAQIFFVSVVQSLQANDFISGSSSILRGIVEEIRVFSQQIFDIMEVPSNVDKIKPDTNVVPYVQLNSSESFDNVPYVKLNRKFVFEL